MSESYPEGHSTQPAGLFEGEPAEKSSPEETLLWTLVHGANDAFGQCDYPNYCKFYGEDPSFCDRSCSESVWDQI